MYYVGLSARGPPSPRAVSNEEYQLVLCRTRVRAHTKTAYLEGQSHENLIRE
jgi:hypothetical protein